MRPGRPGRNVIACAGSVYVADMAETLSDLTTPEAVIVALLGAFLLALPLEERWSRWHYSIGIGLVALVAGVSAILHADATAVVRGALEGAKGFGVAFVIAGLSSHARARAPRRAPRVSDPDEPSA